MRQGFFNAGVYFLVFLLGVFSPSVYSSQERLVHETLSWKWNPRISLGLIQLFMGGVEFFEEKSSPDPSAEKWPRNLWLFEGGYLPLPLQGKSFYLMTLQGGAQFFLTATSPFFLGLFLGYRQVGFQGNLSALKADEEILATDAFLRLHTLFLGPRFGLRIPMSPSFFLEWDLGVDFPLASWGSLWFSNHLTGETSENSSNLRSDSSLAMGRVAGLLWPRLTFLRGVWRF